MMNTAHRHGWRPWALASAALLALGTGVAPAVAGPFLPDGGPSTAPDDPVPLARPAEQDGAGQPGRVIRLTAVGAEQEAVDLGPAGPSLGDEAAFTDTLMSRRRTVGHSGYACTTTSAALGESHCAATLVLDGRGTVAAQGLVPDAGPPFTVAVTGGTGAFAGTAGELLVRSVRGEPDELALVLRLRR
jgi:hypothetical protein